ncbi:MAG: helix-turn-helix domain-containing protein [Eubacteriales bacterium]
MDKKENVLKKDEKLTHRKVVTVKEAAAAMCVSTGSVYNLIKQEKLPCVHIGRLVRIPIKALNEFMGYDVCEV